MRGEDISTGKDWWDKDWWDIDKMLDLVRGLGDTGDKVDALYRLMYAETREDYETEIAMLAMRGE